MQKDSNTFIKILIVLVIASLALLAIVYFMLQAGKSTGKGPIAGPGEEVPIREPMEEWFFSHGRLVVHEDITYNDADWQEKCDGSEWQKGFLTGQKLTYTNFKYNYNLDVVYTEFYNDDLIIFPFINDAYVDRFDYYATVTEDEKGNYDLPCGPHGPVPGFSLEVEEVKTASEIKDDVMANNMEGFDSEFKEITIGDWNAVAYRVAGYMDYYHIILLGDEYNYHFTAGGMDDLKFKEMIEKDFYLMGEVRSMPVKTLLENIDDPEMQEMCMASAWRLEKEKGYDYINEEYGIKFKYFNRPFSNDELIAEPYTIKKDEDGEFDLFVTYWPEGTDSYPCHGGVGVFSRLHLMITDDAVGFEEYDSKGKIKNIEYLETIKEGLGDYDQIIERVVLENGKAYIFSSSIIEERDVEGEDGEMIHIDAFDGTDQLDYVFENLEFLE